MGDNNIGADGTGRYDQATNICRAPVRDEWIIGVARGQLPWFGIMKLLYMGKTEEVPNNSWYNLGISLTLLIVGPFVVEHIYSKWKKEDGKDEPFDNDYFKRPPDPK